MRFGLRLPLRLACVFQHWEGVKSMICAPYDKRLFASCRDHLPNSCRDAEGRGEPSLCHSAVSCNSTGF